MKREIQNPKSKIQNYQRLAWALWGGEVLEDELPAAAAHLPPLDETLLHRLARMAEEKSYARPRLGWAISAVCDAAATHLGQPFLQAVAAWYLARAANDWVRPTRVEAAIQRARPLFVALGRTDWVAACDWQINAVPWLRPDARQAASTLATVAEQLSTTEDATWPAGCRLALAYAYLLLGELRLAEDTLAQVEATFHLLGQRYALLRCAYVRIGILRRQGHVHESLALATDTLATCKQLDTVVDAARTRLQMGYCYWALQEDYPAAEACFRQAIGRFTEADLPLLVAQAHDGLAQVYQDVGRLAEAGEALAAARRIYDPYPVVVPLAACLVDSGYLELHRGQPAAALHYFQQAEQLYQQFGNQVQVATTTMYQGEAHQQLGCYQFALHCLEQALDRFQELGDPVRRLECQRRLARAWLNLGRPDVCQSLLTQVAAHYEESGQPALLAVILTHQARIFMIEGKLAEATAYLQKALVAAEKAAVQPQVALVQRWLGQVYFQMGRFDEAGDYLARAEARFAELVMPAEQAACQVALGDYLADRHRSTEAETAWRKALELTQSLLPEVACAAWAGLAGLAEARGEIGSALAAYRAMAGVLSSLRQHLHQPALAGPYLRRSAPALDKAVGLSGRAAAPLETLCLIEESKAQGFARQLSNSATALRWQTAGSITPDTADRQREVASAIHWLQERLQPEPETGGLRRAWPQADLIQPLRRKVQEFDHLVGRLERSQQEWLNGPATTFHLDQFRQAASAALGDDWVALNFYLAGDALSVAICTTQECQTQQREMPAAVRLALRLCSQAHRQPPRLTVADLAALGQWLLPADLLSSLSPTTTLLIVPHRQLHTIPWAALRWPGQSTCLVEGCVPLVAPSMLSWRLLWQREEAQFVEANRPRLGRGLVLGISGFGDRYAPLPQVSAEVETLRAYLDPASRFLTGTAANWDALRSLASDEGLDSFALWHIASHAYHDPLTGRLSGFALYDRDVWLDELWQLSPLPDLVILSACQGNQSVIYEGDEPVGLTATCLAAGARSVVGSLWPVLDTGAADLMAAFYARLGQGVGPAAALAQAQRQAIERGLDVTQWASFLCVGLP